jgi:hypothetical protein
MSSSDRASHQNSPSQEAEQLVEKSVEMEEEKTAAASVLSLKSHERACTRACKQEKKGKRMKKQEETRTIPRRNGEERGGEI